MRRYFYAFDLLLCSMFALFAWHTMVYGWHGFEWIVFFTLLLRMNVSVMLYRKERSAVWGIGVFFVLFGCLLGMRILKDPWPSKSLMTAWVWVMPLVLYLGLWFGKKLESRNGGWSSAFGSYLFRDTAGRKYLSFAAIMGIAYLIGADMGYGLGRWGIITLPAVAYYLINGWQGRRPRWWEYAVIIVGMLLFFYAQHHVDTERILMLAASAVLILAVCMWMLAKTKDWCGAIVSFVLMAFVIPLMVLGYNIYAATDTCRVKKYTAEYVQTGVLIVEGKDGYGLRDRYRLVIPAIYDDINELEERAHQTQ